MRIHSWFLLPALLIRPLTCAAYEGDPVTNAVRDISWLQGAPARLDGGPAAYLAGGLLGAGALLYSFDGQIRHAARKNRSASLDDVSRQAEKIGNGGYELAFMGALAGAGYAFKDDKLKDTAFLAAEAFLAANAIGAVVKYTAGRSRPYAEDGKRAFKPFAFKTSRASFPSGHTTSAFAVASVIAARYTSPWTRAAAYGAASAAALQRAYADKHWASDVFFGAVLGTVAGRAAVRRAGVRADEHARILPVYGPGFSGAVAALPF